MGRRRRGWETAGPGRFPPLLVIASLTVLVATVAALVNASFDRSTGTVEVHDDQEEPDQPVVPGQLPSPGPSGLTRLPWLAGTWDRPHSGPLPAAPTSAAVWIDANDGSGGGELMVVAGSPGTMRTAATFDPASGSWHELPPPPDESAFGTGHLLVWTGQEVLLWGRWEPTRLQPHGAAFDPASNGWRHLPVAPVEDLGPNPVAVWTGEELVIWGPTLERVFHPASGAGMAYRPATDSWRRLPDAPISQVTAVGGAWTEVGLVLWGSVLASPDQADEGARTFALLYDPNTDGWRSLPPPPLHRPGRAAAVSTGQSVILWGRPLTDGDGSPGGAELVLPAGRWRVLPALPAADWPSNAELAGAQAVWTGTRMIVVGGPEPLVPLALENGEQPRWHRLEGWRFAARRDPSVFWTGQQLLVWGGVPVEGRGAPELLSWQPAEPREPSS